MQKNNRNPENDILNAILGAAILGAAAEQAEPKTELDEHMKLAQKVRNHYDAFLAVGFTEEQATAFATAMLN